MTGFARRQGEVGAVSWVWELRSVNGRGLDIKLRLPNGLDALELPLRDLAAKRLKRGNVSGTLTIKREAAAGITADLAALERIKELAIDLADSIPGALPPRAELLLALPGVMRSVSAQDDTEELQAALQEQVRAGFAAALEELVAARAGEGARLAGIAAVLLSEIEACTRPPRQRPRPSRRCTKPGCRRSWRKSSAPRRLCRRKKSPRKSRCWPPSRMCAKSSTGCTPISKPPARCWRKVWRSAASLIF